MIRLPITSSTGTTYVPDFIDELSPATAESRAKATAATEAARAARAAVPEARAALAAISIVTTPGPVYAPAPTTTTAAHDKARMALAKAEEASTAADRAEKRARESFHKIASEEGKRPEVAEAVAALFTKADEAALTAWEAALAALAKRDELDRLAGVRTLTPDGIYAATTNGIPLRYRRRVDDEGYGIRYAIKNVGDHFAISSTIAGGAR